MNSSPASCKEAVFSVQAELGLDLPRGVVLNAGQDPERLSCVETSQLLVLQHYATARLERPM